jgi:hypothetical protein
VYLKAEPMNILNIPINGQENISAINDEETRALSLFYRAFNGRDIELMQQSWLAADDISMDNPIGGISRGWDEISQIYNNIFNGKAIVHVEFYDYSMHKSPNMFFATGRECGYCKTANKQLPIEIRTTRIFIFSSRAWRQIHHHGSMDDAAMLKQYQKVISDR